MSCCFVFSKPESKGGGEGGGGGGEQPVFLFRGNTEDAMPYHQKGFRLILEVMYNHVCANTFTW